MGCGRAAATVSAALSVAALAAACAPVPVEQAERMCLEDARLAAHPRTSLVMGAGTGGRKYVGGSISFSSDYFLGRDPAEVFASCVYQKSGQPPTRPLYDRPDWRG